MVEEQKKEIVVNRTYDAPVDRVWGAFTDPKIVPRWWGPPGVTIPVCEIELIKGGRIHIVMKAGPAMGPAEGQEWPMNGTFDEVTENRSLVYSSESEQESDGVKTILGTKTTVSFVEENGKTTVNVRIVLTKVSDTPQAKYSVQGMEWGWTQQMEKLVAVLQE